MGKNDPVGLKALATRQKAKGLQKLRWYCQMCQKQCRDENGFKCHCMSEGHQRQMQVFGQDPDKFIDTYSEEFEASFVEHFKRTHRFSRVAATVLYNEYIADRHHVHMNSTQWTTLTEFVKYLGRTGVCKVEDTPKGWFMTLIDREPETLFKEGVKLKRERGELLEQERQAREIELQVERAVKLQKGNDADEDDKPSQKELQARAEGEKIAFALPKGETAPGTGLRGSGRDTSISFDEAGPSTSISKSLGSKKAGTSSGVGGGGMSSLAAMMAEDEKQKERANRKDYWLVEGIVVKVMSKALVEKGYYKQKGVIVKVIGKYVGELEMLNSGDVLRVDQEELETVLPQIGGNVRIVNGAYRGCVGRLLAINADKFCAEVQITQGPYEGRLIRAIDYEDICKLAVDRHD